MSVLLTLDEISSSNLSGPFDRTERNNHILILFSGFIKQECCSSSGYLIFENVVAACEHID